MLGQESLNAGLDGRVALVTGAASGIGRASAIALARVGARVVAADIEREGGEETVSLIIGGGGDARFVSVDVSQEADVESLIQDIVKTDGRLDCAVNNAGVLAYGISVDEHSEDLWNSTIDVNLKGTWLCMKHEIRQMRAQQNGTIVNMSSVLGLRGIAGSAAYVASKHGVIGLTRTAALECASDGIRVNAICPSWIRTPPIGFMMSFAPEIEEQFTSMTPLGRLGTPEDVANAVVWLCSDAAAFVTGHSLVIDGGMMA